MPQKKGHTFKPYPFPRTIFSRFKIESEKDKSESVLCEKKENFQGNLEEIVLKSLVDEKNQEFANRSSGTSKYSENFHSLNDISESSDSFKEDF